MRLRQTRLKLIGAAMGALVLQACASAPFDLAAAPEAPPAIASQQELRTAAATLIATVDEQGWQLAETRTSAFSLLGRLVGGAGEAEGESVEGGVDAWLEQHGAGASGQLMADIRLTSALTAEVVAAAGAVAASEAQFERAAIDRDIAEAEAALTAARKARAFFLAVHDEIATRQPLGAQPEIATALTGLERRIEALATSADALADRRWGNAPGAVS